MTERQIAWIGLGNMGLPMATNLANSGWKVSAFNRTPRHLPGTGLRIAATLAEATKGQRLFATMLSDDQAVGSVLKGPSGLLDLLPEGGVHLSFSTLSPTFVEEIAKEHGRRGQILVSCPVFGRPDRARDATLTVVAAGPESIVNDLKPVFAAVGSTLFIAGQEPQQANWVKILGNFTLGGLLETLAETLSLAERAGVDQQLLIDILDTALYHSPVFKNYGQLMAEKNWDPAGFRMRLGLKDIRLVLKESDRLDAALPLADLLHSGFLSGINRGLGDLDWSALLKVRSDDAGAPATGKSPFPS